MVVWFCSWVKANEKDNGILRVGVMSPSFSGNVELMKERSLMTSSELLVSTGKHILIIGYDPTSVTSKQCKHKKNNGPYWEFSISCEKWSLNSVFEGSGEGLVSVMWADVSSSMVNVRHLMSVCCHFTYWKQDTPNTSLLSVITGFMVF